VSCDALGTLARSASLGATIGAISHHYDVATDFYRLWLDNSLTYSGALWKDAHDSLESAQARKLDFHITQVGGRNLKRVLDVGCGWGSLLTRLVDVHNVRHVVGLTLSQAQADWIAGLSRPELDCRLEGWLDHKPDAPYDAIISIGAFEHFARAGLEPSLKLASYREFFQRCYDWLNPSGRLALQTIAYGNLSRADLNRFIAADIFPESDLPTLAEIAIASQGLFEITSHRNDREHYERTTREWLRRLRANRHLAVPLVGDLVFERYAKYLSLFTIGFHTGRMHLLRITFQRNNSPHFWFPGGKLGV